MPPKTSWSFIECYALADIAKESVEGGYDELVEAVKIKLPVMEIQMCWTAD